MNQSCVIHTRGRSREVVNGGPETASCTLLGVHGGYGKGLDGTTYRADITQIH